MNHDESARGSGARFHLGTALRRLIISTAAGFVLALSLAVAATAPATAASDIQGCAAARSVEAAACAAAPTSVTTPARVAQPSRGMLAAVWFGGGIAVLAAGYAAVDLAVRRDRASESSRP